MRIWGGEEERMKGRGEEEERKRRSRVGDYHRMQRVGVARSGAKEKWSREQTAVGRELAAVNR
jgi:hypothetical protein